MAIMMKDLCNDVNRYVGYDVMTKVEIPASVVERFYNFDSYTVHKLVYGMFAKVREDDDKDGKSGFYYSSEKDESGNVHITISSNRAPVNKPLAGEVVYSGKVAKSRYENGKTFNFRIVVNAEKSMAVKGRRGKVVPVYGGDNIKEWFTDVALRHGFEVDSDSLVVENAFFDRFRKGKHKVTLNKASLRGTLKVVDQEAFREAVSSGIGRGKAFGCGLLRVEG